MRTRLKIERDQQPSSPLRLLPEAPGEPLELALSYLEQHQIPDGSWYGEYSGPLFLTPVYIMTHYILGKTLEPEHQEGMIAGILGVQNEDGGWGLYEKGPSHVYTSILNYVGLRLLKVEAERAPMRHALQWIHQKGGPCASASWGKLILSVMGLYEYQGMQPLLPELWSLPKALPLHPSKMWCHTRMVYLPMAYLYGIKAQIPDSTLLSAVRKELYPEGYTSIHWPSMKTRIAPEDQYVPHSAFLRIANRGMSLYERFHPSALRKKALATLLEHIEYEDRHTSYICLGPVNKLLNTIVWHFARPGGQEVELHCKRMPIYLHEGNEYVKMNGYNSSQLWDTAFAVQAMLETEASETHPEMLYRALRFVQKQQIYSDLPERHHYSRAVTKGGWPFSTKDQGWPTSDCTAEALKALLTAYQKGHLSEEDASQQAISGVEYLFALQNKDGGWAPYERTRAPQWLELFNASDVFSDVMIDYSYVECTSSCIQALVAFTNAFPEHKDRRLQRAIRQGKDFILQHQKSDGSWYGSWGICFTYGTWFAVWGLLDAGISADDPRIQKACDFLESKQLSDGGWGESIESCKALRYISTQEGMSVMTSWALLALIKAGRSQSESVQRGIAFLKGKQQVDGSWPEEAIAGIFNKSCGIHYDSYLKVFPLWALAQYQKYCTYNGFVHAD